MVVLSSASQTSKSEVFIEGMDKLIKSNVDNYTATGTIWKVSSMIHHENNNIPRGFGLRTLTLWLLSPFESAVFPLFT